VAALLKISLSPTLISNTPWSRQEGEAAHLVLEVRQQLGGDPQGARR